AVRDGLLGDVTRNADARTILVTDGQETVALMHLDDTPFNLHESASTWRQLSITMAKGGFRSEINEMRFLQRDPRVVALPVSTFQASSLGVQVYKLAVNPFRFPEAVLISNGGQGYGEVPFKLDPDNPGYVRMDNRLVRRLFGDFSPSRGDLVLSKSGELLGVMVSSDLCALINDFNPMGKLPTGDLTGLDTRKFFEQIQARAIPRAPSVRGR